MAGNLEKNKIFAAILIALLVALVATLVADALVQPHYLEKNIYVIEVAEDQAKGATIQEVEEDILPLIEKGDIEKGKTVARKCVQCHVFDKNAPHRIGPRLWAVVGRKQANWPDFPYSKAARAQGGVWTEKDLSEYLKKPRAYMPGTKMSFIGLKKIADRANLIAYLKTLKD